MVTSIRKRSNQADIAAEARVSTATVSRVINTSGVVSDSVRERVEEAMERLGYVPNGVARSLTTNRSWTIGAVVPTLENDLFARGIDGLMKRLRTMDYSLMVMSSDYSLEDEYILVKRLLERGVDGLLLVGQSRLPRTTELLARSGRPYVEAYSSDLSERDNHIGFNNRAAAKSLVEHLYQLGHRHFGMLAGITKDNDRALGRRDGTLEALRSLGLDANSNIVTEVPYEIDAAREAFASLIQSNNPPTALVCGNDLIAMGALIEAQSMGLIIPDQISVVGFDDHPLSRHIWPGLTTVRVPAGRMGQESAVALVAAIEHGTPVGRRDIAAPLIRRNSTAPPRTTDSLSFTPKK